ncbi:unnamed protein product, partial [Gadus morhua 'NCC']
MKRSKPSGVQGRKHQKRRKKRKPSIEMLSGNICRAQHLQENGHLILHVQLSSELLKVERFSSPGKGNGLRAVSGVPAGGRVWSAAPLRRLRLQHPDRRGLQRLLHTPCVVAEVLPVSDRSLLATRPARYQGPDRLGAAGSQDPLHPHVGIHRQSRVRSCTPLEEHESHLDSMSEQKRRGLSQLADMLQIYLQPEVPDLMEEMTSLPPSCQDPLSLLAK